MRLYKWSFAVLLLLIQCNLHAKTENNLTEDHIGVDRWEFNVAFGYAAIENPLTKRDNAKTHVLPQWQYYGERFYIDNLSLGYALVEDEHFYLDAFTYLNEDGVLFNADDHDLTFLDVRNFIPTRPMIIRYVPPNIERELTYMAGLKANLDFNWFELKFIFAQDVTVGHDGQEATFSLSDTIHWNNFNLFYELGAIHKDYRLVNYYYQFTPEEIVSRTPGPEVTDDWLKNPFIKLAVTYRLSPHWSAVASFNKQWLHKDIKKTLFVESDNYVKGFVGINYKF